MASKHCSDEANLKRVLPTLFSDSELRDEFKKRCVKLKALDKKSKDELLQIYMRHFMSLPQRQFPNNHHGKIINQMILKEQSKLRKHIEAVNCELQFGFTDGRKDPQNSPSSYTKRNEGSLICDRLKPPITTTDVSGKKISLSRSSSTSSDPCLEKIVIKNRSKDVQRDSTRETKDETTKHRVELKRTYSDSEKSQDQSSPSKKVRQRIAWP